MTEAGPAEAVSSGGERAGAGELAGASKAANRNGRADPNVTRYGSEHVGRFDDLLEAGPAGAASNAPAATDAAAGTEPSIPPDASAPENQGAALPDQLLALINGASVALRPSATAPTAAGLDGNPSSGATSATGLPAGVLTAGGLPGPSSQPGMPTTTGATLAVPGAVPASTDTASAGISLPLMSADALPMTQAGGRNATGIDGKAGDPAFTALIETSLLDGASRETTAGDATGLLPTTSAAATSPATAVRTIPGAPMALPAEPQDGFDDGFGARLGWMAEQRIGHAEIRLHPENLGPIDVRVQLDGTRVNAEFHSAHAEVRQAIEASVPRLREMLGQQGLQLGQADVGQHRPGAGQARSDAAPMGTSGDPSAADRAPATAPRARSRGLVDEYA